MVIDCNKNNKVAKGESIGEKEVVLVSSEMGEEGVVSLEKGKGELEGKVKIVTSPRIELEEKVVTHQGEVESNMEKEKATTHQGEDETNMTKGSNKTYELDGHLGI